jgi:hypothetical protein
MNETKLNNANNLRNDLNHLENVIDRIQYFNMEYDKSIKRKRTLSSIKAFLTSSISFGKNKIGIHQYNDKHWYNTQIDIDEVKDLRTKAEYIQARHDILEFMEKRLTTVFNNTEYRLKKL